MVLSGGPFSDALNNSMAFSPKLRPAPKRSCFVCEDPGRQDDYPVPVGTHFIWDTLSLVEGIHRPVRGRFKKILVPLGAPFPQPPQDGGDPDEWKIITESQVWLEGFKDHPPALRVLSISGELSLNAMSTTYKNLTYKKEAQAGQIPIARICECVPYENSYGRFGIPVVEIIDFIDRDDDRFGRPIIRPPLPILGSSYAEPAKLPPGNDNGPEVKIDIPPATKDSPPVPEPAKPPSPPAVNDDLFARYRPAGAGQRPY